MTKQETIERGLQLRKEIYGNDAVEGRMRNAGEYGAPLQDLINGYAYGDIWQRPELARKQRSLVTIAINAAINRQFELRVHVQGALKNGCTPEEIREVLLHVALYCGIPASMDAFKTTQEVLAAA